MTARSALRNIPLDKLVLSPTNVRKTPSSAAEDAELEASIRASGLKQNLVVHPMGDAKDVHAVVAGGRRLKVLQKLAAEGGSRPASRCRAWSKSPKRLWRPR